MNLASLHVKNLSKKFVMHNQGGAEISVLENASLSVLPGECVVLDGPSGSGKSTLLKCIYGTYRATTGSVVICEEKNPLEVVGADPQSILELRRSTVSYVSQFLRVVPRVPALDVIAEPLLSEAGDDEVLASRAHVEARHLLLRLRIPPRLWDVPPATFSGGEQQRVNIARSFIKPTPLLLLDEPTASLDAQNRRTVISMIREARERGVAILGIFHDADTRNAVATRVVNMADFR